LALVLVLCKSGFCDGRRQQMVVEYWLRGLRGDLGFGMCDGEPDRRMTFETGGCVMEDSTVSQLWNDTVSQTGRRSFAVGLWDLPADCQGCTRQRFVALSYPTDDCSGASFDSSTWPMWGGRNWDCLAGAECNFAPAVFDDYFCAQSCNYTNFDHSVLMNTETIDISRFCMRRGDIPDGPISVDVTYIIVGPPMSTTTPATTTPATDVSAAVGGARNKGARRSKAVGLAPVLLSLVPAWMY